MICEKVILMSCKVLRQQQSLLENIDEIVAANRKVFAGKIEGLHSSADTISNTIDRLEVMILINVCNLLTSS